MSLQRGDCLCKARAHLVQVVALWPQRFVTIKLRKAGNTDKAATFLNKVSSQWDERAVIARETRAQHYVMLCIPFTGDMQDAGILQSKQVVLDGDEAGVERRHYSQAMSQHLQDPDLISPGSAHRLLSLGSTTVVV